MRWAAGNGSKLPVQGTFYAHRTLSYDMRINHGGLHIGVSQQFLHRADVVAGLEHMRRKAMTKGMAARWLQDSRFVHGRLHCSLQDLFMLMTASRLARIHISAERLRGKHPLPTPLSCRVGILTRNCRWQRNTRLSQFALPPKSIKQLR